MNFHRIGILTILAVYLLIFVGGVVRSTGSGMGCPDWPKCFGMWVPPTSIDQLPLNYQEIYGAKLKGEVVFNPVKTWIEYLNRLLGVSIGILVFFTFLASLKFWKKNSKVIFWSVCVLILTGLQGWIGSKVVSTELAHYMVSIHMIVAILIVFILIYVLVEAGGSFEIENRISKNGYILLSSVLFITFFQIVLGTQVREKIDEIAKLMGKANRTNWVESVGINFLIHRSFSILVLILHLALFNYLRKKLNNEGLKNINNAMIVIIFLEILSGITLNYLGFPAFLQPFHLTLAVVALGLQSFLLFSIKKYNKLSINTK